MECQTPVTQSHQAQPDWPRPPNWLLPRHLCSSYVPEPKTFLHHASAEAKQLWMVGVLLVMARASPAMRVVIVALLALATMAALPRRLWEPQLKRLGGLCAILFVFTALGESRPVIPPRSCSRLCALAGRAVEVAAGQRCALLRATLLSTAEAFPPLKQHPILLTRHSCAMLQVLMACHLSLWTDPCQPPRR